MTGKWGLAPHSLHPKGSFLPTDQGLKADKDALTNETELGHHKVKDT